MTLRRVHVTIVAVEKQLSITYLCVRVFSRLRACAQERGRVHVRACM
jgi:hypothetical protein